MHSRTVKLDPQEWTAYIEAISAGGEAAQVEVGVLNTSKSTRPRRGPLFALSYDPGANELEVAVRAAGGQCAAVRYFVTAPHTILVEEQPGTRTIIVDDASGVRTLIRVYDTPGVGETRAHPPAAGPAAGLGGAGARTRGAPPA